MFIKRLIITTKYRRQSCD